MSRKTWSLDTETAEQLEELAGRKPDESANDFLARIAEMLDGSEIGTSVTEPNAPAPADVTQPNADSSGEHEDTDAGDRNLLTSEEFEARLEDLETRLPQRTADEFETRFR